MGHSLQESAEVEAKPLRLEDASIYAAINRWDEIGCYEQVLDTLRDRLPPDILAYINGNPRVGAVGRLKFVETRFASGSLTISCELSTPGADEKFPLDATAQEYFTSAMTAHRLSIVRALSDTIPPMSKDCELSVCIPAAAHEEGGNIYHCLASFAKQTADPAKFEIVVFANHPVADSSGRPVAADSTIREVNRFIEDFPELQVHLMYGVCELPSLSIGLIRGLLTDAVLFRAAQNRRAHEDHILLSNDADAYGRRPQYIQNYIDQFRRHPHVDSFIGLVDYDPLSYHNNPLVYLGCRLSGLLDAAGRVWGGLRLAPGANFAFRASTYAAVRGYRELSVSEDVNLGIRMRWLRDGADFHSASEWAGAASRIFTSSRRAQSAVAVDCVPIEQWALSATDFGPINSKIRPAERMGEDLFMAQIMSPDFVNRVEHVINRTLLVADPIRPEDRIQNRYLCQILNGYFGLEYGITKTGQVKVEDVSGFVQHLLRYRREGVSIFKRQCALD